MAQKINSTKLLPKSKISSLVMKKDTAIVLIDKSKIILDIKKISKSSSEKESDDVKISDRNNELTQIQEKLLTIQKLLGSELKSLKTKTEGTRKEKERKEFEEGEKKLEAPKVKGLKLPSVRVPGASFLERIKRFIFFTALGWLFPKIIEFLPKLKWIGNIIGGVSNFAVGLFGKLFDGFMSLVKFGGDLKDKTIGFIAQLKGGDYQKEFTKLENLFNTFVNTSIIAGVLALDVGLAALDQLNKPRKPPKPPGGAPPGGAPSIPYKYDPKRALIRKKYGDSAAKIYDNLIASGKNSKQAHDILQSRYIKTGKIKPERMMGSLGGGIRGSSIRRRGILAAPRRLLIRKIGKLPKIPKLKPPKAPSWWTKITGAISSKFSKFASKLAGPFAKFAGAAIPGIGAAVGFMDAKARSESGDKLGAFLAGLSASLDAFTASVAVAGLASAATGIGIPFAAVLGTAAAAAGTISMAIDVVLLIRDLLKTFGVPVFAKGGILTNGEEKDSGEVTRGGKYVNRPIKRTLRVEVIKKPPKAAPIKSSPGKDVGGELKIQRLFPSPESILKTNKNAKKGIIGGSSVSTPSPTVTEDRPNPFSVLTTTAKTLKEIPLIGGIMGSGVDLAMGQRIDSKRIVKPFSSAIKYLVDTLTVEGINFNITSLFNDMKAFNEGGVVPPSRTLKRDLFDIEGLLDKVLGPIIQQKVNEAIQNIQNELKKKGELLGSEGGGKEGGAPDEEGYEYSEGGIATQLGIPKAVSVAKKLIADLGITPAQAAGIVGNFMHESAGMNPAEVQGDPLGVPEKPPAVGTKEKGYGWAQWTNDRLDKFLKFYGGDKGKIATDNDNYRYLIHEFKTTEPIDKPGYNDGTMFPENDVDAATTWFRRNWERAGIPADGKRIKSAREVFEKIKGLSREQAKRDVAEAGAIRRGGRTSAGNGKFIQGNSGRSEGVHFHIGTTKPGDPSGPALVAFNVIKHFLGKKSIFIGRSREFVNSRSTDDKIRGYVSRGQAAHRKTEIDIQVGGEQGLGNRVPFPFKLKKLQYSESDGYGTSADIVGANAFVGHGRYKPDGSLAKQQRLVMSSGPPDYYYEKGGLTKNYPHIALIGEKGAEFVIDADSTKAIEKKFPGLLYSINKENGYGAVKALFNYFRKPKTKISKIRTQKIQSPEYQKVTPINLIAQSKPKIPNVKTFAPYESYAPTEENMNVAILPVLIKQQIPFPQKSGNSDPIMFPIPIPIRVNTTESFNNGRGY